MLLVLLVLVGLWRPWGSDDETVEAAREWQPLDEFLGPSIPLPEEARRLEVRGDVTTAGTRRLIESAVSTYEKSKTFYADAAERAAELPLRAPLEGETTVVLVSDRHDNVGMDKVARAIGDRAGATAVFDAGDDTSPGSTWEAFSLDSVAAAWTRTPGSGVPRADRGETTRSPIPAATEPTRQTLPRSASSGSVPLSTSAALQVGTTPAERKPGRIEAPTGTGISGRSSRAAAKGIAPRERPSSWRVARNPRTTPSRSTAKLTCATPEAALKPAPGRSHRLVPSGGAARREGLAGSAEARA